MRVGILRLPPVFFVVFFLSGCRRMRGSFNPGKWGEGAGAGAGANLQLCVLVLPFILARSHDVVDRGRVIRCGRKDRTRRPRIPC